MPSQGRLSLAFLQDRPQVAAGPSAYRSSALLPGVQGTSQAVCSLGVFVLYPEIQRPRQPLDAALAVPGMPAHVRMEGGVSVAPRPAQEGGPPLRWSQGGWWPGAGLGDTLGGSGACSQNDDVEKAEEESPASSQA